MPIPLGILAQFRQAAAGDFVLLETQVLSSAAASVTFSGLSTYAASYRHLQIRVVARAEASSRSRLQINGDTGNNYATHLLIGDGGSVSSAAASSFDRISLSRIDNTANSFSVNVIDILDAFSTNKTKTVRVLGGLASGVNEITLTSGFLNSTAAVSSLRIFTDSPSYVTGSRFSLYGVKG